MSKYFVIAAIGALASLLVAVILIFIPSFEQFDLNSSVYTYSNKYSKINSDMKLDPTNSGLPLGTWNSKPPFATYDATEEEWYAIAQVCIAENGDTKEAMMTEATQMVNRREYYMFANYKKTGSTIYETVMHSGYWQPANQGTYKSKKPTEEQISWVKHVIAEGYRVMPAYVDGHACIEGSYTPKITNNGVAADATDRSNYKQGVTIIDWSHLGWSSGVFFKFGNPENKHSDPFIENNNAKFKAAQQEKYGDFYYDVEGNYHGTFPGMQQAAASYSNGSFSGDSLTYGSWIQIPDEMVNKRFFTYTDYSRCVTESMGSKQGAAKIYWKKNNMIEHDEHNNCYIKYNNVNYLCVALPSRVCCADGTEFYESNGHTFLAKCEDGEIIPMVMVDAKGDSDTMANDHWGQRGPQQCCYIESYVWGSVPDNPNNNPYSPLHKDGEFNNLKKVVAICKGPDIGGS